MLAREREIDITDEEGRFTQGDPLVIWALRQIKDSDLSVERWRKNAKEADRFMSGKHFSKADQEALEKESRPTAAFNIAQKFIRFVSGLERRSKQEIRFLPRDMTNEGQDMAAELVTKAYEWVIAGCDGYDERSRAFEDMLVRGMGWTDTTFDRSMNPRGEIVVSRIDGHEMQWDYMAQKTNLADARWISRTKQIPKEIALQRWPEYRPMIMAETGPRDLSGMASMSILRSEREAIPQESARWPGVERGHVPIVEFQWYDEVPGVLFTTEEGTEEWLDEEGYKKYQAEYKRLTRKTLPEGERLLMRQYQRMLICGKTKIAGPHRLPGRNFTFNCMTGQWDGEEGVWYGYMKFLMDPQKYLTKFINQVMEIITKQAKGGLIAETDAFANVQKAENEYAKIGSITWANPGGIDKIKEKSLPEIPPASIQMFKVCTDMLREVTGVNPEIAMGTGAADQPAMTMQQRQLASIALLATEFASLERYRIREAKTVLAFLPLIADDRIIRVGGPYDAQALQLIRDPFMLDYDVVLDEDTHDPNVRQNYLTTIMQIAPTLIRTGGFLPEMIDFLPLPASFRHSLKQAIVQQQQQQGQEQPKGKQDAPEEIAARVQKLTADAQYAQAKAATLIEQMQDEKVKAQMEAELSQGKMQLDASIKQQELQLKAQESQANQQIAASQLQKNVIEAQQTAVQQDMQRGLLRQKSEADQLKTQVDYHRSLADMQMAREKNEASVNLVKEKAKTDRMKAKQQLKMQAKKQSSPKS